MWRWALWVIFAALTVIVLAIVSLAYAPRLLGYQRTTSGEWVPVRCAHLVAHRVTNRREAILAARTIWYCTHAEIRNTSEQSWLDHFDAYRGKGADPVIAEVRAGMRKNYLRWLPRDLPSEAPDEYVWHVGPVIPDGYVGSGNVFEIAERDGRLVDMGFFQ